MSAFPQSLKTWRQTRRFSRLDLALEADVSARHISFLETGRARPSQEMVARLGEALRLPLDARNQLLSHAGFAARYPGRNWQTADMAPIRRAVDHMLTGHAPYPALALDRRWIIKGMNAQARALYGLLGVGDDDSLVDLMVSDSLPPLIENWPAVAHHAAQRLRTESMAQGGVAELDAAAAHLSRVARPLDRGLEPVVPTILNTGTVRLSMFATIAQFGTPEDVTLDDLKIELYFPADEPTALALRQMAAG
ncbi:MAG: helix-turn-helix transcriptional regulator [Pseudomonadota bacterium]